MKTHECDMGGAVGLPKQFYEWLFTLEESRFASGHISIVYRYLRQQGLNSDEWLDAAIFRHLLSVKRYFAFPELQKLKLITVTCSTMRSAIGHERRKQASEPVAVSLLDVIPGIEDLCYIDTIATPEINQEEGEQVENYL